MGNTASRREPAKTPPLNDSWRIQSSLRSNKSDHTANNKSSSDHEHESSYRMDSLQSNLMRAHVRRDPMKLYEVLEILGEGSMGSVTRVRKRDTAVGGSAREQFVREQQGCWSLLFRACRYGEGKKNQAFFSLSSRGISSSLRASSSHGSESEVGVMEESTHSNKALLKKSSSLITYNSKKDVFYALKSIHLNRCMNATYKEELKNEIDILRHLDHPNIVRAIETFDYHEQLVMVLELCCGGDLYQRDPYTEPQAHDILQGLFSAISYLHSKDICHRDLKFENIMFVSGKSDEVKIIDFGLSQKFAANEHLHDAVGTVYTMAPELLAGNYEAKCDVWSLGVIAFMLLSSNMPFYGKDRVSVIKKIVKGHYKFVGRRWNKVSTEARQFVESLLQHDPNNRPSAHEVWMNSRWLNQGIGVEEADLMDNVQATMVAFASYSTLKKLALMVVAYKSTTEEIGYLRSMFERFNKHRNGEICLEEFKEVLAENNYEYSDEEAEEIFQGVDVDGTGSVHYMEFLAATLEAHGSIDEERLAEAFDRIDSDDSGYITVANLRDFLGDEVPQDYLDRIVEEADLTHDHRISYEEFLALWDDSCDVRMQESREHVKNKHRQISVAPVMNSQSSLTELASSERSKTSTGSSTTGSDMFRLLKKEQSVRGVWV